jgi:hypothetical protein
MTTAEGKRLMALIEHPMPDIRRAGEVAYDEGRERWSNPYEENTPAYLNWDSGWLDGKQRAS